MSAIAAIAAATELGLRVPDDLSVVGFDNIPESALCTPPLTTVNQPIRQMGEQSIQLLLAADPGADPRGDPHHPRHQPRHPPVSATALTPPGRTDGPPRDH